MGHVGPGQHEGEGTGPGSSPSGPIRSWPSRSGRRRPSAVRSRPRAGGPRIWRARSSLPRPPLPRGEANRIVRPVGRSRERGQGRGGRPGGEGRRHPDLLHAGRSDVPAGGRRRAAGPAERGQVRRAVPREGRRQLGQGSGRPAVALPQRRVPRLAGRAAHRGEERPDLPSVARAVPGSTSTRRWSRSRATSSRRTTAPSGSPWCAASPRCCWSTRKRPRPQNLANALRSQYIDVKLTSGPRACPPRWPRSRSTTA